MVCPERADGGGSAGARSEAGKGGKNAGMAVEENRNSCGIGYADDDDIERL
jgi:hypothetical protein